MKIAISTESTSDLSKEQLKEFGIYSVPFSIILGSQSFLDGEDVNSKNVFDYVKQTGQLPKTSAVNQFQYEEHFNNLLKEYDAVIHIAFSSELSSACRNAVLASKECKNVWIIDSLQLSSGVALLAIYASQLVKENKGVDEIIKLVNDRIGNVQTSFVLQNVDYLYKGGRCSKMAALGANLFHICPQIIMKGGKMDQGKKYRGKFYNVVANYVDDTLAEFNHPDLSMVFITNTTLEDDSIRNMVNEKLVKFGFKKVLYGNVGCTISSHCGPNTLGILYFNDK